MHDVGIAVCVLLYILLYFCPSSSKRDEKNVAGLNMTRQTVSFAFVAVKDFNHFDYE